MLEQLLTHGLQWATYFSEALLVGVLVLRGQWKRQAGVFLYLFLFLFLDGAVRPYALFHYGLKSPHHEYYYVYWLTDVILTVSAFALVCWFFRRACASDEKMWHKLRPMLGLVFILLAAISYFMIASKIHDFYSDFVTQLQQNTYFACRVLTTLLYVMLQSAEARDEQLAMLVCGMGILFAAPAAVLAAFKLLPRSDYVSILINHVDQLCTLGMLFTWWYAITKLPYGATVRMDVPAVAELQ